MYKVTSISLLKHKANTLMYKTMLDITSHSQLVNIARFVAINSISFTN